MDVERVAPATSRASNASMPESREQYVQWSIGAFPDFGAGMLKFMTLVKYICDMDAANYVMSNKHKLMLAMLIDGENWRAHCRQAFHYDDGAWTRAAGLHLEAWQTLLALEGLFVQLSLNVEQDGNVVDWSWSSASRPIMDIILEFMQKFEASETAGGRGQGQQRSCSQSHQQ